jgi:hypothetical protein
MGQSFKPLSNTVSLKTTPRAGALAACCLALCVLCAPARADTASEQHTLTVSGSGEVRAAPDEAMLSAGVVTNARTAAAALSENTRRMNAVFATLKNAGVAEKDMQTANFSVQPQYATDKNGNTLQNVTGYQVSNTVNVAVDIAKTGATLDALVSSGANSIGDIAFAFKDSKSLMAQARADAVADAISRAQTLARAAGVTLGPIASISEGGGYEPPRPMYRMMAGMAAPSSVPVAAGEQTLTANVNITWDIR